MWTLIATLSLVIQVAVGVPSFGNGPQQEFWNEVDNGISGDLTHQLRKPLSWQEKYRLQNLLEDDYDSREPDKHLGDDYPQSEDQHVEEMQWLKAPRPTPTPPTEQNNEELRSEKLQAENSLKPEDNLSLSGFGNLVTNDINKSIPTPEKSADIKTTDTTTQTDFTLEEKEQRKEEIDEILKSLSFVMRQMTPSEEEYLYRSLEQLLLQHIKEKTPENTNDMQKTFGKVILTITSRPCDQEDGQEGSSQEETSQIRFSKVQDAPSTKVPTIKGVLIKSLVPKEYFVVKDLYDIMKAKAAPNAAGEPEDNPCGPADEPSDKDFESSIKTPSRYAIYPSVDRSMPPPKYFPDFADQGTQTGGEEYKMPNFPGVFRLPVQEDALDRFSETKKQPQPDLFNSMSHIRGSAQQLPFDNANLDPVFMSFVNNILTKFNDQAAQSYQLRNSQMSAKGDMMPRQNADRREFTPISYRQGKILFG